MGVPPRHPSVDRIFHEINHLAIGVPLFIYGNPHVSFSDNLPCRGYCMRARISIIFIVGACKGTKRWCHSFKGDKHDPSVELKCEHFVR